MRCKRMVGITVMALMAVTACSEMNGPDGASFKGENTPAGVTTGTTDVTLVSCRPRPERVDTFTVTSRGGKFEVDYARLDVPKNALGSDLPRRFEMRTPSANFNSVLFTPIDGQGTIRFASPVKLELKYKNCDGKVAKQKRMVYTTDAVDPETGLPRVISVVGHDDDFFTMSVAGETMHFSRYAVSY
jgi:hypothetical protein